MGVIWCLHGFLGRGADWDFLRDAGFDIRAPSLFAGDSLEQVRPAADDILLGYSMGARLALQVLQTQRVAKAVLISAGIAVAEPGRKELDETWALRFESEPWDSVVEAWNAQAVFGGRKNPLVRKESDFDRHALATALREWSPAVLRTPLPQCPTLWIAGEYDAKYSEAARNAAEKLPNAQLWICPDAGHRVPWEQPARFIERLRQFLATPATRGE
jgi:2-succinyl-6-hydroxy-2,4-cyclohexadiene-1-carboxylate synthase